MGDTKVYSRADIQEAVVDTRQPITNNNKLQLDGVMSATLHNAGDTTITLNGHLTMKPGATIQLAAPHQHVVFNCSLRIRFGPPANPTDINRLEIMESRLAAVPYHNFTRDDPAD